MQREERDRLLLAANVLQVFDEHAVDERPPGQFDRDLAPLFGRQPGEDPSTDELWRLALGLLHLGRALAYQVAQDEGGTPGQVFDGFRNKVRAAPIIEP